MAKTRKMPHPRTVYPDQPAGVCRVCKKHITAKRRRFFCGRQCARIYSQVCDWRYIKRSVLKRDSKTCQICGRRCGEAEQLWWSIRPFLTHKQWGILKRWLRLRKGCGTHFYEIDHIVPVVVSVRNGKAPDHTAKNLRVLCLKCHDRRKHGDDHKA